MARRFEFNGTDMHMIIIEIARTAGHTAVITDRTGDERQRVFIGDNTERFFVFLLAGQPDIGRDVLINGTAGNTGSGKAVGKRHLCRNLEERFGLDRFAMTRVFNNGI